MASFCNGCKHWKFCQPGYGEPGFHWCEKIKKYLLKDRKEICNGKLKEDKNDQGGST